jgi:hypothetical protein
MVTFFSKGDSVTYSNTRVLANASASFTNYNNWGQLNSGKFAINTGLDVWKIKKKLLSGTYHTLRMNLGMTRFIDSVWIKSADRIQVNLQFREKRRNVLVNYSLLFRSQLFNGYSYSRSGGDLKRKKSGAFLMPFQLELGYGMAWEFWNYSTFNIALATLRTRGYLSSYNNSFIKNKEKIARTKNGYVIMDYGLSAQWYISKKIHERLEWIGQGRLFLNGVNKNEVGMDVTNKFKFTIWKYFMLVFDSSVIYDSYFSYKVQTKHEILIGWYFDSKGHKK